VKISNCLTKEKFERGSVCTYSLLLQYTIHLNIEISYLLVYCNNNFKIFDRTMMTFGCTDFNEINANIFYFESSFAHFLIYMIKSLQDMAAFRTIQMINA
jgi:hypothetical protein